MKITSGVSFLMFTVRKVKYEQIINNNAAPLSVSQ